MKSQKKKFFFNKIRKEKKINEKVLNAKDSSEQESNLLDQYVDRMNSHTFLKMNSTGENSFFKKIESFEEKDEEKNKREGFLQ